MKPLLIFIFLVTRVEFSVLSANGFNIDECNYSHEDLKDNSTFEYGGMDTIKYGSLFIGGQFAGSTIIAPMFGYEFFVSEKITLRTSLTLGLDFSWRPPSVEMIPKMRLNYTFTDWFALTTGGGGELRFNPWYLNDPYSHNFPYICTFAQCPTTKYFFFLDAGFQFSLLHSRKIQIIPLFTYFPDSKKFVNEYIGPSLTIEFNYRLK